MFNFLINFSWFLVKKPSYLKKEKKEGRGREGAGEEGEEEEHEERKMGKLERTILTPIPCENKGLLPWNPALPLTS